MMAVNAQYNVARPQSLAVRIAAHQRLRMYRHFLDRLSPDQDDTILDLGATSDDSYDHSNYLVAWYPHKASLTAAGLDDASFLEQRYPGVTFRHADGRTLPFAEASFDYVHSSAVLEHAGTRAEQIQFLREMWRVASKGIYLTTPNRWFPVEFHTVLPLVHWLPHRWFAAILHRLNLPFFTEISNLNLLSRRDLRQAAQEAGIAGATIESVSLGGWPTNLLLFATKS
jgi:hypothetical protein